MVIIIPSYSICLSTLFLSRNFWRQSKLSDLFSNHTCPLLIPWRHQERSGFMALTFSTPKNSDNYHFKCAISSNLFCTCLTWKRNFCLLFLKVLFMPEYYYPYLLIFTMQSYFMSEMWICFGFFSVPISFF